GEIVPTALRARDVAVAEHQREAVDAHVADRAAVTFRFAHHALQRGVAAVGGAVGADPGRIGDAFANGPFHAVGHVVDHGRAPVLVALAFERIAVAAGTAEVDLQHR